jgi:putative phosphoesterase
MRIAILSDVHDNLWNLRVAIESVRAADVLICCGDLCSPFVMDQLAKFPGPVHIVFGNNDADLFRITRKSSERVKVHGEFFETELDGKKVAVNHFDNIARPVALSGEYDLVCYGHNHEFRVMQLGRTTAINPGPIMGAKFPGGQWTDVAPTFVVYETGSGRVEAYEIAAGGEVRPRDFKTENSWG